MLYRGDALDVPYVQALRGRNLAISFQTVDEMIFGAHKAGWGERRLRQMEEFLRRFVLVPGNWELALTSARVRSEIERLGRQLKTADAWILATAVHFNLPLITDDRDHIIPGLTGYTYVSRHGRRPFPTSGLVAAKQSSGHRVTQSAHRVTRSSFFGRCAPEFRAGADTPCAKRHSLSL